MIVAKGNKKRFFTGIEDSLVYYRQIEEDGFLVHFTPRAYMQGGGIYKVLNKINGHCYIGSCKNFFNRFKSHKASISCMRNSNPKLQAAFIEFGWENFVFIILEHVDGDKNELLKREQYYLDTQNPEYNICIIANSALGVKRTEVTKDRVRAANLGLKHPDWRNKIKSAAMLGVKRGPLPEAARKNMSIAQKKLYENGYVNPNRGKKLSAETIKKRVDKVVVPVDQYDLDGVFIKSWNSIKEASIQLGIHESGIGQTANNKQKYCGGFIWRRH